jgi:hypothetical protein
VVGQVVVEEEWQAVEVLLKVVAGNDVLDRGRRLSEYRHGITLLGDALFGDAL